LAEAKEDCDRIRRGQGLPLLRTPDVLKGRDLYSTP
jgi:hypothetical protein